MAIRRISDLPELTSIYDDANIDNCLLEVSYKDDKIYQSFYVKAADLIKMYLDKHGRDQ